jgi:hypothetical protein
MVRPEVGDACEARHPMRPRQRTTRPRPPTTCQRRPALPARGIAPRDVGRVDHPVPWCATPARLDARGRAITDTALAVNHVPRRLALHDWRAVAMTPGAQARAPLGSRGHRSATGLTPRTDVGGQALRTQQARAGPRTAAPPRDELAKPRHTAMLTHLAGQPQPCRDPPRQGHPPEAALGLDAARIGLSLTQVSRVLHQMRLDSLALAAGSRPPRGPRALLAPQGDHDGWPWTPVGQPWHHQADRRSSGPQARQGCACRGAERLVALRAPDALGLARMAANVALTGVSAGGARQMGAEWGGGGQDVSPLLALLGSRPGRRRSGPLFSVQPHLTTV